MQLLDNLWVDGYRYAKAGVMLSDFYIPGVYQPGCEAKLGHEAGVDVSRLHG
jgi:hypothetical protein